MWDKIKEIIMKIKWYLVGLLIIIGIVSVPLNLILFLSKGGWNILDVFILLSFIILFFAAR